MYVHVFITKTCRTTYVRESGHFYLSGISRGLCFTESETPFINIFSHLDWIKKQVGPNQRKNGDSRQFDNSQPTNLDLSTSTKSPVDIERICPIIIESQSESKILSCEGRDRHVNGKVKIDPSSDCHMMQVKANKVLCNSKTEHDISCPILPLNTSTITLVDAQSLCRKNLEEKIKIDETVAEKTDSVNADPVFRFGAPVQSDPAAVVVEATNNPTVQPIPSTETDSNQLPLHF